MVAGRYSGRLAVIAGVAGAFLFLAAPVAAQPRPTPSAASSSPTSRPSPSPSATPSPEPGAFEPVAPAAPAAPSQLPAMVGQPAYVEPEPEPDSRVYAPEPEPEPEPVPEPTAEPEGVPVSGAQHDARLPDPKLLIVAGAAGLAFSTVGVAVVWYRRRSF
ncbi:hypothetical protein R8Z50_00815 [Longispora sp. K20-0274]|uniref:hypothetical protein n=1 Tax=Longispora sp. K20-0274 TaxID=3088255 RepID=UPI003999E7DB